MAPESIHRISLACSWAPTHRAGSVHKVSLVTQRVFTCRFELDVLRQQHGQLLLRYWNYPILWTVDDRDGRTPVTLPADQPVAQAIGHHELAGTPFLQVAGHFGNCIISGRSIERTRVDHYPQVFFGLGPCRRVTRLLILWANHLADGNAELACKLKVALVVAGHAHDSTGAVAHQHIISDPDRNLLAIDGICDVAASKDARLLLLRAHALALAHMQLLLHLIVAFGLAFRSAALLPRC